MPPTAGSSRSSAATRFRHSRSGRNGTTGLSTLFESQAPRPLADRLRPRAIEEVVGQDHLLGRDAPIGRMLAAGRMSSIILWGPPGSGKTTIARLLAER